MMDARSRYPKWWHFKAKGFAPDGVHFCGTARPYRPPRLHPVRYYFIDYGLFHRFLPDRPHFVLDWGGRDDGVPELEKHQHYDPFKVDVFIVCNIFKRLLSGICSLNVSPAQSNHS